MSGPEGGAAAFLDYHPQFLDREVADTLLRRLWRELDWSQPDIVLFGRRMKQPRLVAWYGDAGAAYSYSGLALAPLPWHPALQQLRQRIDSFTRLNFNAVLANAYRDGRDSMGWHADDEPELGPRPAVASLSLGAERRFRLRARQRSGDGQRESLGLVLAHGSLLLMKPGCQERYQHALPRTRKPVDLRINLTFRRVVSRVVPGQPPV